MAFFNSVKNKLFGIFLSLGHYICILPEIQSSKSNLENVCRKVYTVSILSLALFLHASQIFALYQTTTEEIFIFDEVLRNYLITSLHFSCLLKCVFLRGSDSKLLIQQILDFEETLERSDDEEIKKMYKYHVDLAASVKKKFITGVLLISMFYSSAPVSREPYHIETGNNTIMVRQIPMSMWVPESWNYWVASIYSGSAGVFLTVYFTTADLTLFCYIAFATCQLHILKQNIDNFHKICLEIAYSKGCSKEESYRLFQKECIIFHQEIISYVHVLNRNLKNLMLIDMVPGSIQIACSLFQMVKNLNLVQCIILCEFTLTLIFRIFMFTSTIHNMGDLSQKIGSAWYNMDWMELPRDVRNNLMFCIMRSQRPLWITLGDIDTISMGSFLAVLKGAYSYLMVLLTV